MSGKAIFALGIIILITCVVSDWAFGKFFKWLGNYVTTHKDAKFVRWLRERVRKHDERKERKKNKYVSYVKPFPTDDKIIPVDKLFEKD